MLLVILNILTVFIIDLLIVWYPKLKLYLIYSEASLKNGKYVGIYGTDKKFYIEKLLEFNLPDLRNSHLKSYCKSNIQENKIKVFQFKLFKYLYDTSADNFVSIKFNIKTSQENIHNFFLQGLNTTEVSFQKQIFGNCDLEIKVDSVVKLLIKEMTDPFYIFQIFSVALWFKESYYKYALVIVITTIVSLTVSVYETRSNLLNIQRMAKYSCPVNVYRLRDVYYLYNVRMGIKNISLYLAQD